MTSLASVPDPSEDLDMLRVDERGTGVGVCGSGLHGEVRSR